MLVSRSAGGSARALPPPPGARERFKQNPVGEVGEVRQEREAAVGEQVAFRRRRTHPPDQLEIGVPVLRKQVYAVERVEQKPREAAGGERFGLLRDVRYPAGVPRPDIKAVPVGVAVVAAPARGAARVLTQAQVGQRRGPGGPELLEFVVAVVPRLQGDPLEASERRQFARAVVNRQARRERPG